MTSHCPDRGIKEFTAVTRRPHGLPIGWLRSRDHSTAVSLAGLQVTIRLFGNEAPFLRSVSRKVLNGSLFYQSCRERLVYTSLILQLYELEHWGKSAEYY